MSLSAKPVIEYDDSARECQASNKLTPIAVSGSRMLRQCLDGNFRQNCQPSSLMLTFRLFAIRHIPLFDPGVKERPIQMLRVMFANNRVMSV